MDGAPGGTPVTRRGRVRTPSGTGVWPTPMRPTIVVSEHLGPDACRISGDGAECQGSEHGHGGTDGHRGAWTSPVDQHKDQDWNRHHQLGQAEDDQRGSPTQRCAEQRHQLEVSATDAPPSAHDHHEENESAGNGHSQHGLCQCSPPSRASDDERVGKADKRQGIRNPPQAEIKHGDDTQHDQQWKSRPGRDGAAVKPQVKHAECYAEGRAREEKSGPPPDVQRVRYRLEGADGRGPGISREAAR